MAAQEFGELPIGPAHAVLDELDIISDEFNELIGSANCNMTYPVDEALRAIGAIRANLERVRSMIVAARGIEITRVEA